MNNLLLTKETLVAANPRQKYPMAAPHANKTNIRHKKFVVIVRYSPRSPKEDMMAAKRYAWSGEVAKIAS